MIQQSFLHTIHRYKSLYSNRITALPIVILMPHSACNCRCIMCDIWKDNKNLRQLNKNDILGLLGTLKKLGTKKVLMSGGEAMLNPNFFEFCSILKDQGLFISIHSTGISFSNKASLICKHVDEIIISLDGDEVTHNKIRGIPEAYKKLKEGIVAIKELSPSMPVMGRTVIHRLNYSIWPAIVNSARELMLDKISFLPADVSSHAFNREVLWDQNRSAEIMVPLDELPILNKITNELIETHEIDFQSGFIAETPLKLRNIYKYYAALHGLVPFPFKKCNAPWVSTVIEADGSVRPCFFHETKGNIRDKDLSSILNSEENINFRKELLQTKNSICERCVCSLYLPPNVNPVQ